MGLGGSPDVLGADLDDGLGDVQASAQQVAGAPLDGAGLAPAHAGVGDGEHHDPPARVDGVGQLPDLLVGQEAWLGGHEAGDLDALGDVAGDHAVGDRGLEDRRQQHVALAHP